MQSSCKFLEEGNKRMTEGLQNKNFDEIEAAQKLIKLATENQVKWQTCKEKESNWGTDKENCQKS